MANHDYSVQYNELFYRNCYNKITKRLPGYYEKGVVVGLSNHESLAIILPIFAWNSNLESIPKNENDLKFYVDHAYRERFITFDEKEHIEKIMKKEAT